MVRWFRFTPVMADSIGTRPSRRARSPATAPVCHSRPWPLRGGRREGRELDVADGMG